MGALVDDVLGLVHHFGAEKAAIIGHDWGAAIAWEVALRYPDYVWKLAALQVPPVAAWIANMSIRQALRSWYMLFFQIPMVPEWVIKANDFAAIERMLRRTTRPGTLTDTDIAVYKAALREPGALTGAINYYRANALAPFNLLPRRDNIGESRVKVPTLFIYGERDFAIVRETVRGVDFYVDAPYREVRLLTCGHWVQQEAPAEVNAALKDFLDANPE